MEVLLLCRLAMASTNDRRDYKNPLHLGVVDQYLPRKWGKTIPDESFRRRRSQSITVMM